MRPFTVAKPMNTHLDFEHDFKTLVTASRVLCSRGTSWHGASARGRRNAARDDDGCPIFAQDGSPARRTCWRRALFCSRGRSREGGGDIGESPLACDHVWGQVALTATVRPSEFNANACLFLLTGYCYSTMCTSATT